jgi:hypothetical protein
MIDHTKHPTFLRAIKIARMVNCEAKTPRGILSFFKKKRIRFKLSKPRRQTIEAWKKEQADRKADPEAKRALKAGAGSKFRKAYLSKLRREYKKAVTFKGKTIDAVTRDAESVESRIKTLNEIKRLKTIVLSKKISTDYLGKLEVSEGVLVRGFTAKMARKHGATICMVGKEAILAPTKRKSYGIHEDAVPSKWDFRKKRYYGFERCVHHNYVRSFAIFKDRTLDYVLHETKIQLVLPEGYLWGEDYNGLKAFTEFSRQDDYHPDAEELLRKDAVEHIVQCINRFAERRTLMWAQSAVEKAESENIFVCLSDSVRAGNCFNGSLEFARKRNIDPYRHYRASELLDLVGKNDNGDIGRLRLAITAASLRQRKELERGYSLISEHQTQHHA